MKIQVRKNILTHKWEVQTQEQAPAWKKIAAFDNKEQAGNYAIALMQEEYNCEMKTSKGGKPSAPKKKSAQKANKRAKKTK